MYSYITPAEVWYGKRELIGRSMAYAYWHRHNNQYPAWYKSMFKVLKSVEIGPHAYTLVFTDGSREELITCDTVCVYTVNLEKS